MSKRKQQPAKMGALQEFCATVGVFAIGVVLLLVVVVPVGSWAQKAVHDTYYPPPEKIEKVYYCAVPNGWQQCAHEVVENR